MTREKRVREFVSTDWCKGQQMTALPRVAFVFLCSYYSACIKQLFHTVMLCDNLNTKLHANLVSISQKTYCVSITKTNILMTFTEIMTVHFQTYMRQEIHRVHKTKLRFQVTGVSVWLSVCNV
jgi:hypothetical protein